MTIFILIMCALFIVVVWGCLKSGNDRYYDEKMECEYIRDEGVDYHDF